METLSLIREIHESIREFEEKFQEKYSLCLNEGILICELKTKQYSSGEIAKMLGLTYSYASKVIKSVESKGLIERSLGAKDKRQMFFVLTEEGRMKLENIRCKRLEIPEIILKNIFAGENPFDK